MTMSNENLIQLALRLEAASAAYYAGEPTMSDAAFDQLEAQLRKADPAHPTLAKIGAPAEKGWPKVRHPVPMGSLAKAQTDGELSDWFAGLPSKTVFVTEKLDGMSILLTYEGGKLVRASTRGDGVEGEDITRNVRIMQCVPATIPETTDTVYIRGEVVCLKSDFTTNFAGESNPRNTATGTSKRQTGWQKARHLTVVAYNLNYAEPGNSVIDRVPGSKGVNLPFGLSKRSEEFEALQDWGFRVPNFMICSTAAKAIEVRKNYIDKTRDQVDYLIDGLVVEVDNNVTRDGMGETDMRPKGAIAFKFPSESQQTILRKVLWQVGNSGRVTPVAVFDKVSLAGAEVERASLHNVARLKKLKLFIGCQILVSRRNDVIPFVEANIDEGVAYDD